MAKHEPGCRCSLHKPRSPEHRARLSAVLTRHGHSHPHTPEYAAWCQMKQRCLNTNFPAYPDYGGRGVTVCERWMSFGDFLADIGEKPEPKHAYNLDLIDYNGSYEPGNVRWAPRGEQWKRAREFNAKRRAAANQAALSSRKQCVVSRASPKQLTVRSSQVRRVKTPSYRVSSF